MKTTFIAHAVRSFATIYLLMAACLGLAPAARAGMVFELHLVRFVQGQQYKFFTLLYTNSAVSGAPQGTYFIYSPFYSVAQPTNGSWRELVVDTNGVTTIDGAENSYPDFDSVMRQITNGNWTMVFTNTTTTNTYTFKVSAPNVTSNMLPATVITYPAAFALDVPNQPTFTWSGPTNWPVYTTNTFVINYDVSFYFFGNGLPPMQQNWMPGTFPNGINCTFYLDYETNSSPVLITSTTPLDSNSQPFPGWSSADVIQTGDSVAFAVTNPPVASPILVAHYTFDDDNNLGADSSGNGYDLDFNGGNGVASTTDAETGAGAAYFDGNSFFTYNTPPTNVLNTLAGDFSISFWIKTTQNDGNEGGAAWAGDGIVAADIPGGYNDLIPAALDGGEIGFNTGGPYGDDTVNTMADINDGNYHHVVITRTESTGEKDVYIDGVLDNSDFATQNPLSDPRTVAVGCGIDASQSDPNNFDPHQYFQGQLDDLQIYAGVLNSTEVASLYNHPGTTFSGSGGAAAHYDFDENQVLAPDVSGNGNDIIYAGSFNGSGPSITTEAEAGAGAISFDGGSYLTASSNLLSTLAGSFSISLWVNTTQNSVDNPGFFDANGIISADIPGEYNDSIPIGMDEYGDIVFNTGNTDQGYDDEMYSYNTVNDGSWHHVVVTRDQTTGEKDIYIDGTLDNSSPQMGTTNLLNDPVLLTIGALADASDSDPSSPDSTGLNGYNGLLDDIQIYPRVLSPTEVTYLYENPGSTVGGSAPDFNSALNTASLTWTTSGDSDWFVETTNSMDGKAAQSGSVTGSQSSTLSVTVTGPGTLTFYWSSIANDPNGGFDYEFDIDGNYQNDIWGDTDWYQDGPYDIGPGQHTLTWTVYANGDTDPTQAGFLDEVSFVAGTVPVITLNPFDQTNYPGYPVWLAAAATSNPTATWQWYEVGSGAISGATNSYFTPTNSGTAGVTGEYYAIASNPVGSVNTTTAAVTFVSASLPPDWSYAAKSPFGSVDGTQLTKDFYDGVAVDSAGDVYATAQYIGNMNVVSNVTTIATFTTVGANGGAALVKHSANGLPIWAVGLTNNQTASYSYGIGVAAAPGNGAYLSAVLTGTNWLGPNELANNGGLSILLARFDSTGSNVWSRMLGMTGQTLCLYNSLVSDAAGNVTLIGIMSGAVDFGGTILNAGGSQQGFIAQYDPNGNLRWAQLIPNFPLNLAAGGGKLYVSLQSKVTASVTNISIGSLSKVTDRAWGVACLNAADGQSLWLRDVGEQSGANGNGLSDDVPLISVSGTNVFLSGVAYGSGAKFGGLSVSWPEARGFYFARYDTNGNPQIVSGFGNPNLATWSSTADTSGDVYVSGDFDHYAVFGNDLIAAPRYGALGPNYFGQAFVAKFDRDGNPLWARYAVSSDKVNFRGIAAASDGVWACGFFNITNSTLPAQFGAYNLTSDLQITTVGVFAILSWHEAGVLAKITDKATTASPVTLLNPQDDGTNFHFQFLSENGFAHNILYRTNLAVGIWLTNSTVAGNGTVTNISIPLSIFGSSKQGFIRVTTQ